MLGRVLGVFDVVSSIVYRLCCQVLSTCNICEDCSCVRAAQNQAPHFLRTLKLAHQCNRIYSKSHTLHISLHKSGGLYGSIFIYMPMGLHDMLVQVVETLRGSAIALPPLDVMVSGEV